MNSNYKKISFRIANKTDLYLLTDWFNRPHIKEFWDMSGEMWENVESFLNGNKILYDYWIGFFENKPFCLIITSDALDTDFSAPGSGNHLQPFIASNEKVWTIDFMIGEETFFGKGLSYQALDKFAEVHNEIDSFIIDPETSNSKAIHVYEKAGFKKVGFYTPEKGYFSGKEHIIMKKVR